MKDKWLAQKDNILTMLSQGMDIDDIALHYNLRRKTMSDIFYRLDIRGHRPERHKSDDTPCYKMKFMPKWDFSGDNLDLQYR